MRRIFEELRIGDTFYMDIHGVQLLMQKAGLDRGIFLPKIKPDQEVDLVLGLSFDVEAPN